MNIYDSLKRAKKNIKKAIAELETPKPRDSFLQVKFLNVVIENEKTRGFFDESGNIDKAAELLKRKEYEKLLEVCKDIHLEIDALLTVDKEESKRIG